MALSKLSGLLAGTALSTGFICVMDDTIYGQFRRNMILPVKQVLTTFRTHQSIDLDEVMQVG